MASSSGSKSRFTVLEPDANASLPALMLFPAGLPPESTLHNKEGGLRLELLRRSSEKRKAQLELRAETERMQYAGQNHGRESATVRSGGSLLIGVHNKQTGVTKLLPPSALFVMHQSVKEPRISLDAPTAPEESAAYGAQKRQLVSTLGAAKARKKMDQQAQQAVSADAVFNAASLRSDLSKAADASQTEAGSANRSRDEAAMHPLHPPFDLSATTVADAYPRSGLIPDHVWGGLDYAAVKDLNKSQTKRDEAANTAPTLWPPFILAAAAAPLPTDKSKRHAHLRLLSYITYALRFLSVGAIKPRKKDVGRPDYSHDAAKLLIPLPAWEVLVEQYSEPEQRDAVAQRAAAEAAAEAGGTGDVAAPKAPKRLVSRTCREKLCLHILAMALLLGDGRLPCDALAASLSLTEEKCAFYLKQLGCAIAAKRAGTSSRVAALTLPLVFPKPSRGAPQRG